ncbi:MAG: NUDIX hydrolase [Burkholderiaceae bacterium]|nr:NUDIX hydrolase [Burkholderiaceae bacterium]
MSKFEHRAPDGACPQLQETRIEGETVYQGNFLQVERDLVRLPDGKTASREFIRHPGAVVILPLFDDGSVLLERQFRYPIHQAVLEFPAGKIEPGETPLACAQRELQEETGYAAQDWQYVCRVHNALGYSDEFLEIFLARGLTAGKSRPDDEEFIETFTASVDALLEWVRRGDVTDVKTVIGAFWLEKIRAGNWKL